MLVDQRIGTFGITRLAACPRWSLSGGRATPHDPLCVRESKDPTTTTAPGYTSQARPGPRWHRTCACELLGESRPADRWSPPALSRRSSRWSRLSMVYADRPTEVYAGLTAADPGERREVSASRQPPFAVNLDTSCQAPRPLRPPAPSASPDPPPRPARCAARVGAAPDGAHGGRPHRRAARGWPHRRVARVGRAGP